MQKIRNIALIFVVALSAHGFSRLANAQPSHPSKRKIGDSEKFGVQAELMLNFLNEVDHNYDPNPGIVFENEIEGKARYHVRDQAIRIFERLPTHEQKIILEKLMQQERQPEKAGELFSYASRAKKTLEQLKHLNDFDFDLDAFEKFLDEPKVKASKNLDELMGYLPKSVRSRYAGILRSKSTQISSDTFPKMVLMSPRHSNFLLSFSGHPALPLPNLHLIQFWPAHDDKLNADRFEMAQLDFINAPDPSGKWFRFERNTPQECRACHGQTDPRPRINPYNTWPDWIASHDDKLLSGSQEKIVVDEFTRSAPSRLIYRHLVGILDYFKTNLEVATDNPFLNSQLLPRSETSSGRVLNMPNSLLSFDVAQNNYWRIARLIRTSRDYKMYKFVFAAGLNECDDIDQFIPKKIRLNFAHDLKFYQDDTMKVLIRGQYKMDPLLKIEDLDIEALREKVIENLRYLIEGRGFQFYDWLMGIESAYGTNDSATNHLTAVWQIITTLDTDILPLKAGRSSLSCAELKSASLRALSR